MNTSDKNNPKKIIGIQFSILSPEEIKKASTVEITNRDTYINNKPAIGGLFDPRMGVLESGIICPTDGHNFINTPGYFGHINLAKPVFYIQYLQTIIKILKCVCIKCSKLLIDKEKYSYLTNHSNDERWNNVFSLCNKIKRCGEDTNNGCGCKQPYKIKKEGLATIIAEWDSIDNMSEEDKSKLTLKLSPELVLKIFKRISNEDVNFMGFSSIWSRPDWMVCQTMAIPPPAIRPSVKHDSQQRSEDDLTHIIINIIKLNKTIQEKIDQNSANNIIDDWSTVLQYYVAALIDNKIPGVASVAQRSGRPLKSLKERLNGKGGRVRGNLMGKRVDFSARSVITPDPNLSIRELGIPLKIAKNITKPVIVNDRNKKFLMQLIRNGPDVYPGAKIYEKSNGETISLRYVDKDSIVLENGDRVHRHMMDGDAVLFNRQPTLHRMSMMCHIAKIMKQGDTFRMNVADTKPYNADFDGDEMNLHMPQDEEAECELRNLAAVPYQIISPANNKSIVGIFQDSLLGIYRLTRSDIRFNNKTAMNLLMHLNTIDLKNIDFTKMEITNFELLSQIFPNMSLKYKTKRFQEGEDFTKSNNVLEINNGNYVRGHIEKGVLGDGNRGLLQRVYNDYDNFRCSKFIDDLQNIVTEYMKISGFSVGISDLIADADTNNRINETIDKKILEVKNLIDETHLGIFENNSGKSNEQEFEQRVNNILNKASLEAGKIGRENLDQNNRFVIMVNAGSKGSDLNISQMISCLGQQNVDGKRIPYGFQDRTLPHFSKFDDSPSARGFIENSFIGGLKPEELFFHAMGGRVGLIDTAVKTSQTGYIQRRLIKGLEDLMVTYDFTVRNNQGKIIQYKYGDDCFDPIKVEMQQIPFVYMSVEEVYSHYQFVTTKNKDDILNVIYNKSMQSRFKKQKATFTTKCKELIDNTLEIRDEIVKKVFKNIEVKNVVLPVSFSNIINNVKGHQEYNIMIDITPLEILDLLNACYKRLSMYNYVGDNRLFYSLFYFYLSPKELIVTHRLCKKSIELLLSKVELYFKRAIVSPGEMVGMIAAQSIGEPTTQMTLNTFHYAGVASKSNVTRGVPRIEEILSLSENPKAPSCTVFLPKNIEKDQEAVKNYINKIEYTRLRDVVDSVEICFDPDDFNSLLDEDRETFEQYKEFEKMLDECGADEILKREKSKWILRLTLNVENMLDKNVTMDDIHFAINTVYKNEISCLYTDYNSDKLVFRLRLNNIIQNKKGSAINNLDQSDEIYLLTNFQNELLDNLILHGVKKISKVLLRKITDNLEKIDGNYKKQETWVLDTVGSNLLEILAIDFIDPTRTITNNIVEIHNILGIEAARQAIKNEFSEVIEFDSTYINDHHLSMLVDRMCCNDKMVSIFRHGINNDDIGPIAKASFEETPEIFLKAARHAELDLMKGVSANVMCGQEGYFGTGSFEVVLDLNKMTELAKEEKYEYKDTSEFIDKEFSELENTNDFCSIANMSIYSNIIDGPSSVFQDDDDYEIDF